MPSKEEIFDNIAQYTAEQIVQLIKQGTVSILELEDPENTSGEYSNDMRNKVLSLLENNEPADWQKALETNTVAGYQYYLDTYPDGNHREEAREHKRNLLNAKEHRPENSQASTTDNWFSVDKESLPELLAYLEANPNGPNSKEAQRLVNRIRNRIEVSTLTNIDMTALMRRIQNIQADRKVLNADDTIYELLRTNLDKDNDITTEELIRFITEDKNLLSANVIHKLYDEGYLTKEDFVRMGVDMAFVQHMLEDAKPQRFEMPGPLERISRLSTEIYFWGIPSSGKSCALGSILSVANNGNVVSHMVKDNHCQGYGYMSRLMLQFNNNGTVGTLPEGTPTTATYEMGFDLTDHNGMIHPITCIDLAGEIIRCMFKFDSGADMPEDELKTLDTLTRILVDHRTQNRKMHFFVIEYGADDRLYEGLPQKTYLDAAVQYIRTYEIFKHDTDAIFILVSKVDKAPKNAPRNEVVREYLDKNYRGFINGLKEICLENEINGGEIEILPFSLGTVCFQNYCLFQEDAAEFVVRKIIERSTGYKKDKFNKIIGKLKG